MAQLRTQAQIVTSRTGSGGSYLDAIARRLHGVDAYQRCTIAQLEDMLARVTRRAQGDL